MTATKSLVGTELIDIPADGARDSEPLGRPASEIVKRIITLRDKAKEYATGSHQRASNLWRLYLSQFNWEGKSSWQSKVGIPTMFRIMENACAILSSSLVPNMNWFRVADSFGLQDTRSLYAERLQKRNLLYSNFYQDLKLILLEGFLTGLAPVKVGITTLDEQPEVNFERWDYRDFYLDWSGRGRFVISEGEMDVYVLQEMAEEGLLDAAAVREAISKDNPQGGTDENDIKTVWITEFWGDLLNGDGTMLMKNCTVMVANDVSLIRRPIENPFTHKKPPFILFAPLRVPYWVYPTPLASHLSGMVKMITELANGVMDQAMMASIQAYMYDLDRVRPQDLLHGIHPNKAFGVEDLYRGPGIVPLKAGEVAMDALSVMQYLDNETQRDSSMVESLTGVQTPGSRRKTAREVVSNQSASLSLTRAMATDLERTGFEQLLDMMLSVFAQVAAADGGRFAQPDMLGALGPQAAVYLMTMAEEHRYQTMTKGIKHHCFGVSQSIALNEDLQRLMGLAEALHREPTMWQEVNPKKLVEKMIQLHRVAPEEILYTPQERQQMQQQQMMQQMMMQRMMQAQQAQQGMGGPGPAIPPQGPPLPPRGASGPGQSLMAPSPRNTLIPNLRPPMPGQQRAVPRLNPNVVMGGR